VREEYREAIIRNAFRQARPKWYRTYFDICPINNAAAALGVFGRNDAYNMLASYHCERLPPELFVDLLEIVREALTETPKESK
jgi:hypothetical protein